jgi:hypothetical protein
MALSADTIRNFYSPTIGGRDVQAIGADIIYRGSALGNSGGYARPLTANDNFIGFAAEYVDNSAGSSGDKRCQIYVEGYVELAITGASAITDKDAAVYASDDGTFTLTQGSNTYIGRVVEWLSSTTCLVYFDARRGGISAVAELTDSSGGTPATTLAAVTLPAALTDSSGGTPGTTLAAGTNTDALTDSSGGSANTTIDAISGSGADAGINNNFADLAAQLAKQRTLNGVLLNHVASLATELNKATAAITVIRHHSASLAAKVNELSRQTQ